MNEWCKQIPVVGFNSGKYDLILIKKYFTTHVGLLVKTYGSGQAKSWLPYEWFDSADKLDYEGLLLYRCWFSKLKNKFVLSPEEFEECERVFHERGMVTFADWLEYYNNLDVRPFLESLEKMRDFYAILRDP